MGIFSKNQYPDAKLKRTAFDLSFQNNLTTNFGVLKPVFCKEVLAGDTFDIDTTFDLKFMPTVFPIQNRIRAAVKYFFVRHRSLYDNFKEWYTNNDTEDGGLPYLDFYHDAGTSQGMFKSREDCLKFFQLGGIADSFGIPVSRTVPSGVLSPLKYSVSGSVESPFRGFNAWLSAPASKLNNFTLDDIPTSEFSVGSSVYKSHMVTVGGYRTGTPADGRTVGSLLGTTAPSYILSNIFFPSSGSASLPSIVPFLVSSSGLEVQISLNSAYMGLSEASSSGHFSYSQYLADCDGLLKQRFWNDLLSSEYVAVYPILFSSTAQGSPNPTSINSLQILAIGERFHNSDTEPISTIKIPSDVDWTSLPPLADANGIPNFDAKPHFGLLVLGLPRTDENTGYAATVPVTPTTVYVTYSDVGGSFQSSCWLPYAQSQPIGPLVWQHVDDPQGIPFLWKGISALPFRAYEMIYNSFYRDERNNPFQIDGKTYYDKFLPTMKGGADKTLYELHYANWYQDQFTTALPSPQQGEAPLVGISTTAVATLIDPRTEKPVSAQLEVGPDGDTVVGYTTDSDSSAVHRTLVNAATSGISINDFRNVNALQRYLEKNMRQGLRYKDMIQARWGVSPSYKELNMPEFIGGAIQDVTPYQVNQQSQDTSDSPLGSYAGQLGCSGGSKHGVHKFCDEPGYIIGILEVIPTPVYDSLMPKHLTKFNQLDFFNPEFGHIGMQSIPVGEIAPNSLWNSLVAPDTTFGYQRAWYDYLTSNDEVHGQFRTSLRDFCIHREFVTPPTLSEEFLIMKDGESNNIFSVQTDAEGNEIDKILGQIYFDVKAKRPIPRFGIPRLE